MRRLQVAWMIGCALVPMVCAAGTLSGRVTTSDGKPIVDAVVFVQAPDTAAAGGVHTATMDQIDKTFVPGLLPIVVGTRVSFPNHDQIHHHVYSFSRTKSFELPLYKGEDAKPVLFDKVGVVKVGCNIHDWMSGIILVLPTPWFAKTDSDGRWQIANVPAGQHTVVAWHELSKQKPEETAQPATGDANVAEMKFVLTLGAARVRPAMHGSRRDP